MNIRNLSLLLLTGLALKAMQPTSEKLEQQLMQAIDSQDLKAVEKLIAAGANPNCVGTAEEVKDWVPLTLAANKGNERIFKLLLEKGARVGVDIQGEKMAIYKAAWTNQDILGLLLGAGFSIGSDVIRQLHLLSTQRPRAHSTICCYLNSQITFNQQGSHS